MRYLSLRLPYAYVHFQVTGFFVIRQKGKLVQITPFTLAVVRPPLTGEDRIHLLTHGLRVSIVLHSCVQDICSFILVLRSHKWSPIFWSCFCRAIRVLSLRRSCDSVAEHLLRMQKVLGPAPASTFKRICLKPCWTFLSQGRIAGLGPWSDCHFVPASLLGGAGFFGPD